MYYHVSSYLNEGDEKTKTTKNNYEYCDLVSKIDVLEYDKFCKFYFSPEMENAYSNTRRDKAKWACEAIFENIRKRFFPSKPSRIWSFFVVQSLDKARLFNKNERKNKAHIFEIQIVNCANIEHFNMDIYTEADQLLRSGYTHENFDKCIQLAKLYWNQEQLNDDNEEILIDGDVKVCRKIE